MAILPIVVYPDPVLLRPTRPVENFDDELRELLDDMAETMFAASGVGLAANQVGVPLSLFILDLSAGQLDEPPIAFINPKIVSTDGRQTGEEGCLSFPDLSLDVDRSERVTVEAYDPHGEPFTYEGEGLMARAIEHESEHLNGQVFLRHLSSIRRELIRKQIKKRIKAGDWLAAVSG